MYQAREQFVRTARDGAKVLAVMLYVGVGYVLSSRGNTPKKQARLEFVRTAWEGAKVLCCSVNNVSRQYTG